MKRTLIAVVALLIAVLCVTPLLAAAPTTSAQAGPSSRTNAGEDRFITVNGVRLHYVDWGGTGEALLFLTALGGTANDFQALAVPFTDHFHVLGLTRRGQGQSEKPDSGYDTSTLTEDIKTFLDALSIQQVILVGYSVAGNEETEFAGRYPERVAKLVYLDAAYDLVENEEHRRHTDLPPLSGVDKVTLELIARSNEYHPDYSRIKAHALSFFVTYDQPPKFPAWDEATKKKLLANWYDYGKAYRREQIERFQAGVKRAKVVELHNTEHATFVFEQSQQVIIIREMRKFLDGATQ